MISTKTNRNAVTGRIAVVKVKGVGHRTGYPLIILYIWIIARIPRKLQPLIINDEEQRNYNDENTKGVIRAINKGKRDHNNIQ